ncbi:hypothetical protein MA16_Dca023600 [Dendrobium catenatum]|uniref:Uncharacterized protein n=1 Tax=Dendrobium catenatum TaxID=906689 RepID=A0A2I0X5X3_9ASPA|nr:hypothetical protein MA16_Dca023600 [Dendrobium catenatum]
MVEIQISSLAQTPGDSVKASTGLSDVKENQSPASNQVTTSNTDAKADIYKLVLDIFEEPESLEAINYHVDVGHIYSTIDDYHFKSACTG